MNVFRMNYTTDREMVLNTKKLNSEGELQFKVKNIINKYGEKRVFLNSQKLMIRC